MKAYIFNENRQQIEVVISSVQDGLKKSFYDLFAVEAPWYEEHNEYVFQFSTTGGVKCTPSLGNVVSGRSLHGKEALEKFREIRYNHAIAIG
jgi:hypothetical protein